MIKNLLTKGSDDMLRSGDSASRSFSIDSHLSARLALNKLRW